MIKSIYIRNFRSIDRLDFECNRITTFVGENDAGKSNILRALNLFFNGYTDAETPFDFARDFNSYAITGKRKARQVEIKIRFELPEGYRREGFSEKVEWRKIWRENGLMADLGFRRYLGGTNFPSRSKIPTLLDRILYTYAPAIKDQKFFADLQGQLYDVLASVANDPLRTSATSFEEQIGQQLEDLLSAIHSVFGAKSLLRLPDNLRAIFESLEINTDGIPLSRRGDGIKIRHIPMILMFIAEKHDKLLNSGGVRYTHIWGFEEPENSVEMSACFEMANQFLNIITESDRYQLFLTTHSPIFYGMDGPGEANPNDKCWVSRYFVQKERHASKIDYRPLSEVDESMGLMPIVAPHVEKAREQYERVRNELKEAKEIAEHKRPTLFLEGDNDVFVVGKALDVFAPGMKDRIDLRAGGDMGYGSASALASRSLAWLLEMRHRKSENRVRAAAIFDADKTGKKAHAQLLEDAKQFKLDIGPHFKAYLLNTPYRLQHIASKHFKFSIDLEAYYGDCVWEHAEQKGWLEEMEDPRCGLSDDMVKEYFSTQLDPRDKLDPPDLRRLKSKFTTRGKECAARYISGLSIEKAEESLSDFKQLIEKIVSHLLSVT